MAAAMLAELPATGREAAEDPALLTVLDRAPLGDPVLDDALAAIRPGPGTRVVPGLLVRIAAQNVLDTAGPPPGAPDVEIRLAGGRRRAAVGLVSRR